MSDGWPMERCGSCGAMIGVNFDNRTVRVRCDKCRYVTQLDPTGEARKLAEELRRQIKLGDITGWTAIKLVFPWEVDDEV